MHHELEFTLFAGRLKGAKREAISAAQTIHNRRVSMREREGEREREREIGEETRERERVRGSLLFVLCFVCVSFLFAPVLFGCEKLPTRNGKSLRSAQTPICAVG